MAKPKSSIKKAEKPTVKNGGITKPAAKGEKATKAVKNAVAEKNGKNKKKKPVKEPTPEPEDESVDSSSSSSDEETVPKKVHQAAKVGKEAAKKAIVDDDSSEESSSDDSKKKKPANVSSSLMKKVKKADSSDESKDESSSQSEDESESEESDVVETKTLKTSAGKKTAGKIAKKELQKSDSDSGSGSSDSTSSSDSSDSDSQTQTVSTKFNGVSKTTTTSEEDSDSSDSSSEEESEDEGSESKLSPPKKDNQVSSEDSEESSSDEAMSVVPEEPKKRKAESTMKTPMKKPKTDLIESSTNESTNLFVGHLSWNVDEEWLRREFEKFGEIIGCRIVLRDDGKSKGFGYVDFANVESARKAFKGMAGKEIDGRAINVDYSHPRTERTTPNERANKYGDKIGEPTDTVFVGNLSFDADEDAVRNAFATCGTILSCRLPTFPDTGKPKGFGYVQFSSVEEAQKAVEMNGHFIAGRPCRLDFSTPKTHNGDGNYRRQSSGFGGRGGYTDRGNRGRGGFRGGRVSRGGTMGKRGTSFAGKKTTFH